MCVLSVEEMSACMYDMGVIWAYETCKHFV